MSPRYAFVFGATLLMTVAASSAQAQFIIGHRGASFDAPENTLAAFREAWIQRADGVEGDFYFTKDNQIVCIHDATTERTGGKKLDVATSTLAELRSLEYGSWKNAKFRGEPIPTFAEVHAVIPLGKRFVVELKTGPEIVPLLKAEFDRLRPDVANTLIIAFNKATVKACKQQLPAYKAHWLTSYKQDKVTGKWAPKLDDVAKGLAESGADGLGTNGNRKIVTPEFLTKLRRRGMGEFHVWTVDEPDDAKFFRDMGAIGITTNKPGLIRRSLEQ